MSPFSLSIGSLVQKIIEADVSSYRGSNKHGLNTYAGNDNEAWGAVVSYLKGTWDYDKWRVEKRFRASREFKALGVDNFRAKVARTLRDEQLAKNGDKLSNSSFPLSGKGKLS